jgi:hypothetical protein
MQQVEMTNTAAPTAGHAQAIPSFIRPWLTGRRGLIIGGVAVVGAGLALGWNWLTAVGISPIILSLAPCAAMCAVGACAHDESQFSGRAAKLSRPGNAACSEIYDRSIGRMIVGDIAGDRWPASRAR